MPGPLPGRGRNSTVEKFTHQLRLESGSCMGDESSPHSRCTSPDLQGYTTAGEEVVAEESGSNSSASSNRTVRDFSPPQLRPRAKTVPRFIWKRPPGYVKPRSDLPLPPRDSRGRFQSRQCLGGVVIGDVGFLSGIFSPDRDDF